MTEFDQTISDDSREPWVAPRLQRLPVTSTSSGLPLSIETSTSGSGPNSTIIQYGPS